MAAAQHTTGPSGEVARRACRQAGVDPGDLVLLRATSNAVYRCGAHVAKVYRPTPVVAQMGRAAAAVAVLADAGAPVVRPSFDGRLFEHPDGSVVFWPYIHQVRAATWSDLGSVVRGLHATGQPLVERLVLPAWPGLIGTRWATDPYRATANPDRVAAARLDAAAEALTGRCRDLAVASPTVLHGDVSLGNVVVGSSGPRLIDFDWMSAGPAAFDVVALLAEVRAGTARRTDVDAFVSAYGSDLRGSPGIDVALEVRELEAVVFRLAMACRNGADLDWFPAAVERWRERPGAGTTS